jgi:hypothetical protein
MSSNNTIQVRYECFRVQPSLNSDHPCIVLEHTKLQKQSKTLVKELLTQPFISPTHKRTEGRVPVWGYEFTSKDATLKGGVQQKPLPR